MREVGRDPLGFSEIAGGERRRQRETARAGCFRGQHAIDRVLDHKTLPRIEIQTCARLEEDVRRGLLSLDLAAGDDRRKVGRLNVDLAEVGLDLDRVGA